MLNVYIKHIFDIFAYLHFGVCVCVIFGSPWNAWRVLSHTDRLMALSRYDDPIWTASFTGQKNMSFADGDSSRDDETFDFCLSVYMRCIMLWYIAESEITYTFQH